MSPQTIWIRVVAILLIILGFGAALHIFSTATGAELTTFPAIMIGLFVLLLLIGGFALLFSTNGLGTNEHAFGMPPGTVRASLALGILVAMIAMSIYLMQVADELEQPSKSANKIEKIEGGYVFIDKDENKSLYLTANEAFKRSLATQIFTALSTTLAAVIAFYFGSKAAGSNAVASKKETPEDPALTAFRKKEATAKGFLKRIEKMRAEIQEYAKPGSANPELAEERSKLSEHAAKLLATAAFELEAIEKTMAGLQKKLQENETPDFESADKATSACLAKISRVDGQMERLHALSDLQEI